MEVQPGSFASLRAGGARPRPGNATKSWSNTGAEETGRYLAAELRRRTFGGFDVLPGATARGVGNIELILEKAKAARVAMKVIPDRRARRGHDTGARFGGLVLRRAVISAIAAGGGRGWPDPQHIG